MLLTEHPHVSNPPLGFYARRDGSYDRPIISFMTDLRVEDMGVSHIQRERRLLNILARLPDIREAKQLGKYIVATFGMCDVVDEAQGQKMLATNQYLVLPDSPKSELWEVTRRPWWEFVECFDEHDGCIKAPLNIRNPEFTPETIDERIDEFEENQGKVQVLSPFTIEKMSAGAVKESYLRKLARITITG